MSVVPLRFREWWDDFERPVSSLMDQHFGRGWFRDDLISRLSDWSLREPRHHFDTYYRPWRSLVNRDSGLSTVKSDKDKFQVILDVQQFSPEEIKVKIVGNSVIVEAEHEEKQDEHGFISRRFVRRYVLPSSHDLMNVTSTLSSDGILTISAPKKAVTNSDQERLINIVHTGAPAESKTETKITTESS